MSHALTVPSVDALQTTGVHFQTSEQPLFPARYAKPTTFPMESENDSHAQIFVNPPEPNMVTDSFTYSHSHIYLHVQCMYCEKKKPA